MAGEEVDCAGSRHFLRGHGMTGVAAMVVGEPTGLSLVTAHKGCLWIRVTARGAAAHASRPELGRNAVMTMMELLPRLAAFDVSAPAHPLLSEATIVPTTITGGSSVNIIPDACSVEFDVRTLPDQDTGALLDRFHEAVADFTLRTSGADVAVRVFNDRPPVQTSPTDPLIVAFQQAGQGILGDELHPRASPVSPTPRSSSHRPGFPPRHLRTRRREPHAPRQRTGAVDDLVAASPSLAALPSSLAG